MTQQHDSYPGGPAVQAPVSQSSVSARQRMWNKDTPLIILVVFLIFVAATGVYLLAR